VTTATETPGPAGDAAVLVLGDNDALAQALMRRLEQEGAAAELALRRSDSELSAMLGEGRWRATVVVTRDDVLALRLALLSAHLRPDLPLWVTMFDRTVSRELQHVAPIVHVLSSAEIAAAELADQCAAAIGAGARRRWPGIRLVDDALRLLFAAGIGLFLALLVEVVITIVALHDDLVDAFYFSTRSVATVASAPAAAAGPAWFKILSALNMVAALLLVAVFTAALVRRLSRRRLTMLFGPRAAPARDHVLLIGFGQVGFRLAQALRERGIPVLGVERDPEAPCVRLARTARIPVAIGRGDDRETLRRLGIRRCAAIAAVTSSDLVNVAVGLAGSDLRPDLPIVLRLGDGDVAAETDSLLHLGRISDIHRLLAETLARAIREGPEAATAGGG
jgi:voltage-gated potassium channel Kch